MIRKQPNNIRPFSPENSRFITDNSLAALARWLRILGYDTVVFPKEAGRDLLRQADAEKRIVLTRRDDMVQRQFSGILFLISSTDVGNQLNAVIERFSLRIERKSMFGICLGCNVKLRSVGKQDVRDLVPPYVFENCDEYNQCPQCKKIYWMGTHPRNALRFMEKHIPNHLP